MTSPTHVIENPLSGERITIMERPRLTGDTLIWDLVLAPEGPSAEQPQPTVSCSACSVRTARARVLTVAPSTYGRRW